MKFREFIAWFFVVGLVAADAILMMAIRNQNDACAKEKLEAGEMLFECGTALEELEQLCSEEGKAYMERGNLIFKCQQDICEVNGWSPPPDWEEMKKEAERYSKENP